MRLFRSEAARQTNSFLYAITFAFCLSLSLGCFTTPQAADAPSDSTLPQVLRIGISGDYAPFAVWDWPPAETSPHNPKSSLSAPDLPRLPMGFSVEIARAYAKERGLSIEWVKFRWPELAADLAAARFDLALSGVTVRSDRALLGRFSLALTTSGAVALLPPRSKEARRIAAGEAPIGVLNTPGIRIAVNAGGHLEAVTRRLFPRAEIDPVPSNAAVLDRLQARVGRADAVITDLPEAPHWQALRPELVVTPAFTQDRKAAWFALRREALVADFDAWLIDFESQGGLAELRARFQLPAVATARPDKALLAALDDRLGLMIDVAESKRILAKPIEDLSREARVLNAAIAGFQREAKKRNLRGFDAAAIRRLFRAQIEAAKSIQRAHLERSAAIRRRAPTAAEKAAAQHRLDAEIRPALIFFGDRITRLLVACHADPDARPERGDVARALTPHAIPKGQIEEIERALDALLRPDAGPRARSIRPGSAEVGRPRSG